MDEARMMSLVHGAQSLSGLLADLRREEALPYQVARATKLFLLFRARERGVPLAGQFELTPLCNLDCRMCYVHLDGERLQGRKPLSADAWEQLMQQAIDAGMMYACLTGGECLTYPDFDRLYLFLHERGVQVSVLTNGVLLDEKRIRFFRAHPPSGIQVTLYGPDDAVYRRVTGHAVFERVVRNIRLADEAGLPILVTLTPSKYLGADAQRLVAFAATLGVRFEIGSSLMPPREDTGRREEAHNISWADYFRLLKLKMQLSGHTPPEECAMDLPRPGHTPGTPQFGLRCGGGRSNFTITWEGRMCPCNGLSHLYAEPLRQGFLEAWQQVHSAAEAYPLPVECEGCPYQKVAYHCPARYTRDDQPGHANAWMCQWCEEFVRSGLQKLS